MLYIYGWWFGTWLLFFHSVRKNNPNWLYNIFPRGRLNHQPDIWLMTKSVWLILWLSWGSRGPWGLALCALLRGAHGCLQIASRLGPNSGISFISNGKVKVPEIFFCEEMPVLRIYPGKIWEANWSIPLKVDLGWVVFHVETTTGLCYREYPYKINIALYGTNVPPF